MCRLRLRLVGRDVDYVCVWLCVPGAPGYPAAAPGTMDYLAAAGVAQYPPGAGVYPAAALAMAAAAAGQSPGTTGLLDQPLSSSSSTPAHGEYRPERERKLERKIITNISQRIKEKLGKQDLN